MTEWASDSMRDTIDTALNSYRAADPNRFEQEVFEATKRELKPKARKGAVGAIAGILRSKSMLNDKKVERIRAVLEGIGLTVEGDLLADFREASEGVETDALHNAVDSYVGTLLEETRGVARQAGKVSSVIVSKILGGESGAMKSEMDKWAFVEGAEGGLQRKLQFEITKKRLHAVAGMNMGVCVAVDDRLWNKPEFMNVVLFADDGVARGGMHFEIVSSDGKKYLSLPGINPSLAALREVDAKKLTQAMLEYAKDCARAIEADAVLIPTNPGIFSNREELHGIITDMKLPVKSLKQPHQFAYAPFYYSWQDAYEIAL